MTEFLRELLRCLLDEVLIQLFLHQVDGAAAKTAAHYAGAGYVALAGQLVQEVQFLAGDLVQAAETEVGLVHHLAHGLIVVPLQGVANVQHALNLANHIFGLTGEAASPLGFLFYLDLGLAEGDAVAVETGFGYGTRARTADFLNYYRVALDQGDFRSWDRWRYGSYKHFTPDYYTLGYITIGGVRYIYDYPLFTADFLARSRKHPFSFTQRNMKKTAAERSGKPFKETFTEVLEGLNNQWREEARAREPFIPQEQLTQAKSLPRSYSSTVFLGGTLFLL